MRRTLLRCTTSVAIVLAAAVVVIDPTPSSAGPPVVSRTIRATPAVSADLKAAFLDFKIEHKDMVRTDRITPAGRTHLAYDAVDHRYWALAYFDLVYPASLTAEISFQDGGSIGIFVTIGSRPWRMITSPALPLCPRDFPLVVARLWGPATFAACPA
jgi:hypothetical protein